MYSKLQRPLIIQLNTAVILQDSRRVRANGQCPLPLVDHIGFESAGQRQMLLVDARSAGVYFEWVGQSVVLQMAHRAQLD